MKKTTAIICAYNEQESISNIIKKVHNIKLFDKIIVINDGSQDLTRIIIEKLRTNLDFIDIHFAKNRGKGFAMARGIEETISEYILFIDADLSDFKTTHALQLLNPLISGEADMVLGQPSNTLVNYKINPFKKLTGQRAILRKDILPIIKKMKTSGFGVETLINLYYNANHKTIKHICLNKVAHPTKFSKTKPLIALKEFAIAFHQIIATTFINFDLIRKSTKNRMNAMIIQTHKNR